MSSSVKSSLSKYRVMARIFMPPFLRENEIRRRRFGEIRIRRNGEVLIKKLNTTDYNDAWWEWEEELGLNTEPPFSRDRYAE